MKGWRRAPQRMTGIPEHEVCADLDACYAYAQQLTQQHGTTYYFAARFFPPSIRRSIYGLYGFVRVPDEIVDNPEGDRRDCAAQLRALDDWRAQFETGLNGDPVAHPALRAFLDTMQRHAIPPEYPRAFLDSMAMDLEVTRYETFEALQKYTYGSASVIGLMICSIVGLRDRAALPYAADLGLAMQLTNFLRDIGEDYRERGRIYLPLEDLEYFGYSEGDLAAATIDERFVRLMRFEIARNRAIYRRAELGISALPEFARYPIRLAGRLYAAILQRIEANGYDVFHRRAATTKTYKLRTAAAMWAAERLGRPLPLIPTGIDGNEVC